MRKKSKVSPNASQESSNDVDMKISSDDNDGWSNVNQTNGKPRIMYEGVLPIDLLIECRDFVMNIVVQARDTNVRELRIKVDNQTKNGSISKVRYYYDREKKQWPNSPVEMARAAVYILRSHGLLRLENEIYKPKSYGGYAMWRGTVHKYKLSEAWNKGNAAERESLCKFVDNYKGVDWKQYARDTCDYLNSVTLGIIGVNERNFELNLDEVVAARVEQ